MKRILFYVWSESWNQKAMSVVSFTLAANMHFRQLRSFLPLYMSTKGLESAATMDYRVTNKL